MPTKKEALNHTLQCVPESIKLNDDSFYFFKTSVSCLFETFIENAIN